MLKNAKKFEFEKKLSKFNLICDFLRLKDGRLWTETIVKYWRQKKLNLSAGSKTKTKVKSGNN